MNYVFVVGRPKDEELQKRIAEENKTNKDILQEDFVDSYYNLVRIHIIRFTHAERDLSRV